MNRRFLLIIAILYSFGMALQSQEKWSVPDSEALKLSPFPFNDDMKSEGMRIYENSCASCHGAPGSGNYARLAPSPGDPAEEKFQKNSDGELFHKIRKGRGSMPAFENVYGEEDVWNVIAFFRSFNKRYVQKLPNIDLGKPLNLTANISYDDNIYNLVVKVYVDKLPAEGVNVSAFVKSQFGMYALPKVQTNINGIAYVPVDADLPANGQGKLVFFTKMSKGYTSIKSTDTLLITTDIKEITSVTDGRHLWSEGHLAPVWLKFTYWGTVIILWVTILFIVIGLFTLRKLK